MKNVFVACAFVGMLSSCGSVLMLNNEYNAPVKATTEVVETSSTIAANDNSNAALLGSLLGSLAGNGFETANNDGTALTTGGVVSGLLGSILNTFTTVDKNTIVGTWNFKGSAFVFESENALASLGSDLVASQLEAKVDQYLAKCNIKEGMCSITFNADNSFAFVMGDRRIDGTYSLNADTKELTMTFGLFKTVANLVYDAGMINLVYQSDALLRMLQTVGARGSNNALALLGTLLNQYDGLRIGMAFAK